MQCNPFLFYFYIIRIALGTFSGNYEDTSMYMGMFAVRLVT